MDTEIYIYIFFYIEIFYLINYYRPTNSYSKIYIKKELTFYNYFLCHQILVTPLIITIRGERNRKKKKRKKSAWSLLVIRPSSSYSLKYDKLINGRREKRQLTQLVMKSRNATW